jgi:DNA polymerase elongation subunit (family B)
MKISFRLIDFSVYNEVVEVEDSSDSDDQKKSFGDKKDFIIQLYGIDSTGKSYSIFLDDFKPFFYISVDDNWTISKKNAFISDLKEEMGRYYENSILENECKLIKRKKLYGFDAGKNYKFILVKFRNTSAMNKVKNLYYEDKMVFDSETGKMKKERSLKENGYDFRGTQTRIYEATIPPLLRFFHIKELSPSGWVYIEKNKLNKHSTKITNCNFEYTTSYKNVKPLKNKEAIVPYKICSYDIEASSSHGDFPLAKKDYSKMTMEILDYWHTESEYIQELTRKEQQNVIRVLIREAFEFENNGNISKIYTKKPIENEHQLNMMVDQILSRKVKDLSIQTDSVTQTIKSFLDKTTKNEADGGNDDNAVENSDNKNFKKGYVKPEKVDSNNTILEILNDSSLKRETKLIHITNVFNNFLPPVKGDKVTFIGSTFVKYGETEPYLNHCIALDTCDSVPGATIESYKTEAEVLLAWTRLIQRENPDIMIGYNIFGFDYQFMFERAQELGIDCLREFLKLSRNKDEICANFRDEDEFRPNKYKIEETSITIASGTHDLAFIKMKGRIQVDLYNYFRREYNLTSYKLDYVSGYFIGDKVKKLDYIDDSTIIHSKNLTGLKPGHFIHFEETGHSSEYYKDGAKFKVTEVDMENGKFMIESHETPDMNKSVKWCLAKDDVTYKDIFRMTNEGPSERAIIAKYCIQDCNLVQNLLRKIDVVTGLVEMANICSVPIDFLIMRGQSIKLFSFVAKRCRQENTVIPVLQKKDDGGYEGAIVLPPKCGLYLDEPVACVDYSSLYPSSMISENISHDSKVWAREYNLRGELINEVGIKDDDGKFLYDNLDGYKYVNIKYDTYEYLIHCKDPGCDYMTDSKAVMKAHMKNKHKKETVPGAAVKTHVGHKVCRYAQFPEGKLGIIPSILSELLAARKATRASAKFKTVSTSIGDYSGMIIDKTDEHITLKDKDGRIKIIETQSVKNIRDTYDDFMKNVLDKRQLAIKVTANSVYGQTGAKISSFYEKDVAASTTATGRKLLTYGKRIIEEVYGDKICETKYGKVHSHAEYIYGDSVLGDTPIIVRDKQTHNILTKKIKCLSTIWDEYDEFKPHDTMLSNRREKQQSIVNNYDVWTKNGWASIRRVIRHKCNKKIYRVVTHNSVIDVTEDHSLLNVNGEKIKPNDCCVGTELLENNIYTNSVKNTFKFDEINSYNTCDISIDEKKAYIYGFFMGDGSCGIYNTKSGIKYTWALNNANMELCELLKKWLEDIYNSNFKILNTITSSNVYKIVPNNGNIKKFVEEYQHMYHDKAKVVSENILNAEVSVKKAFLAGYYAADGNKCFNEPSKVIRFDTKNKVSASSLILLCSSLGYNVSINTRTDKDVYRISCTTNKLRKPTNVIKKLFVKYESYDDFVYDIETEDGTFNTGFPLIVKNTDSVFMSFKLTDPETGEKIVGKPALKHTIELAKEAGELATKFLKAPHDLEYEKTFMPFCLLSKKRYVGMLYEEDPDKCYRKSMGIVLKRRDNAPIVKDVYGGIIDILMKDQDVNKAIQFTRNCLNDIVDEKYPMDKLIITKSLRAFYKNPQQIAHKVLADRMGKRDPGNKPSSGDRIPFVYIQTKGKVKLQGDKIETPSFIQENNLKPDYTHYITNQIMKPVQQVFALVLEDIPEYKKKKNELARKIRGIHRKYKGDEKKQTDYENKYRNAEVKKLIFDNALRKCENAKNGQKSLRSFFG